MWQIVEYLKSPELVVRVQEFFGIKYLKLEDNDAEQEAATVIGQSNGISSTLHHRRNVSNGSSETDEGFNEPGSSGSGSSGVDTRDREEDNAVEKDGGQPADRDAIKPYEITNRFWYYLFLFGTELGDEIFYATMIPFWFWNVDGAVGRRVVFVWSIVMYIGQAAKDIIRWPRPGRPVHRLQQKWGLEYGMPSTHAMVAVSMPFSVTIFMYDRYEFSLITGLLISTIWCSVICLSRLYLGMHSVLDILAGLLLTILLLVPVIPMVNALDNAILTSTFSPVVVFTISVFLIWCYPRSDKWTPTRGDTTMTTSVTAGIQIGVWLNYQLGAMQPPTGLAPPYAIIWPGHSMLGLILLRTVIGLSCVVATRALAKSLCYAVICALLGRDKNELRRSENSLQNHDKTMVELCYKYLACAAIGFNTVYLLPNVFKALDIGRPDFYTEF